MDQVALGFGGEHSFNPVTAPGILDNTAVIAGDGATSQGAHSLEWSNDGTAPTDGTYKFIGSSDLVHWHDLSGTLSFTANGSQVLPANSSGDSFSVANKPYPYVAVLVLSYTAGDGTTAVKFRYTKGS